MKSRHIGIAMAIALVPTLAACGGSGSSAGSGGGKGPLKIALIPPSSGALAVFGSDAVKAWKLAADEANAHGGVDGHKVEIITLQTDGTPASAVRSARKAVTRDGARYISGLVTSGENAALAPQLASLGVVNLVSMSKDDSLTGKDCSPNMYRTTISTGMDVNATAGVLSRMPGKKWAVLMSDILTGHTAADAFQKEAKKAGKQIVSVQYDPLGTTEYGTYITKIKNSGADSLFTFESAADGVAFVNQAKQFSLFTQVKNVLGFSTVSEPTFKAMGDTVLGFKNNLNYTWKFDNPKNAAFVKAYVARYRDKPYFIPAENYIAAQFLFAGVRKAASTDVAKVKTAMNALQIDTISGPLKMRPQDHQALRDTYVGEVVKEGSGLGWKVIATAPPSKTTPQPGAGCEL